MRTVIILAALAALTLGCGTDDGGSEFDGDGEALELQDPDADADVPEDPPPEPPPDTDEETEIPVGDPATCDEAAFLHTYVGCDFWPTVLPNFVGKHFDYAVVVSNAGDATASIEIERNGALVESGEVPPFETRKFFLPWVDELKHWIGMCDTNPDVSAPTFVSRRVPGGAYHLTSSVPVTVYQFNPIEYGPQGGPEGKDWSSCDCMFGCHSYTNDASLLQPGTALTGNYRVTAPAGQNSEDVTQPGYLSITGLYPATMVRMRVSSGGQVVGGDDIPDTPAGGIVEFTLDQGEVVRLVGTPTTDLSGSVINADKPVQVISGAPCHYMPDEYGACDHLEESVFPAEALGTHYLVTIPTNPRGNPIGHVVKLVGNVDGTTLTYPGGPPPGAPSSIGAGQVVDMGIVEVDFEVVGSQPFAVMSFQLGSSLNDPGHIADYRGDPAQSNMYAVEQFRTKYVFLAPDDYDFSFADVVLPDGAVVYLDGVPLSLPVTPVGSGFGVMRVPLPVAAGDFGFTLESDMPVGLQVMGYGFATSYQVPGGLNLTRISEPPFI
jgi:hypothetical protein